jgi:hypothetical protein
VLTEQLRLLDFRCLVDLAKRSPVADHIADHDSLRTTSFDSRFVAKLAILFYVYLRSSADCNRYSRQSNFDRHLRSHSASAALSFRPAPPWITVVYVGQRHSVTELV